MAGFICYNGDLFLFDIHASKGTIQKLMPTESRISISDLNNAGDDVQTVVLLSSLPRGREILKRKLKGKVDSNGRGGYTVALV